MAPGKTNQRILFIQTAFLGDLLLSVPTLKNIREHFQNAEITLVCRQGVGSLFLQLKIVDRVFEIKKGDRTSYRQVLNQIHADKFDLLISPHESFTTAKFVASLRAEKKISFKQWWNFLFFNERLTKNKKLPEALRQLSLLQNHISGLKQKLQAYANENLQEVPTWASPIVALPPQLRMRSICLFPGSVWATKKWTEEGFIQVGKDFLSQGYEVWIMGGPGEEAIAQRVQEQMENATGRVKNFAGKTSLLETLQLVQKCALVVTNDSAGQHLASLVETPTVTVFGPTVPALGYRPWNNQSVIVENKELKCRPCGKHGHHQCPIGTHECMKSIEAKQVVVASQNLLPQWQ